MGSAESKIKSENNSSKSESLTSTPVKTFSTKDLSEFDPRSPSETIPRTPIEVPSQKVPLQNDEVGEKIIGLDPRSPTNQFFRTPIVISNKTPLEVPLKLHNKLLDNAKRSIVYTPTFSRMNADSNQETESPKLLQTKSPECCSIRNRNSSVGMLETNIDYTETDLDNYIIKKSLNSNLTINISEGDITDDLVLQQESCDPRSPSKDFLRTPMQLMDKVSKTDLNIISNELNDDVSTEQEFKNSSDEMLLKVVDEEKSISSEHSDNVNDMKVEEKKKNDFENSFEILKIEDEKIVTSFIVDQTAVRDFDKKLTRIIHEEQHFSAKMEKSSREEKKKKRTPMKDRNIITESARKTKLKVSDKPRNSDDNFITKIPVYQRKEGKKIKTQCENTPPRRDVNSKPKWDSDKTLVI